MCFVLLVADRLHDSTLTKCRSNDKIMSEVVLMEKGVRVTVALSPVVMEKLDQMCADKGVKRPAIISFAIDKLWKEEYSDKK